MPQLNPKMENYDKQKALRKFGLLFLVLLFLVVALFRPQWGKVNEKLDRRGLDLVIALDLSKSMQSDDLKPSRLAKAVQEINNLLDQLKGDRAGLVVFSGSASAISPLTTDYEALRLFLETIQDHHEYRPGTNLTAALTRALELFDYQGEQDRLIVLFTDGENLEGDPQSMAATAKAKRVFIIPVAIGTTQGQPIPEFDAQGNRAGYKKDKKGNIVISHLDLETLQKIASLGPYVLDDNSRNLYNLFNDFQRFKTAKFKDQAAGSKNQRYQLFLFISFWLFLLYYIWDVRYERFKK